MFVLKLFGGLSIESDHDVLSGQAAQRHRLALLALLAVHHPCALSRDKAIAYLWPERDADRARNLLNQAIHALRRALGERAILSSGDDLRFHPDLVACDVAAFEAAIAAGNLERAVGLYDGAFLDGFFLSHAPEFERWVDTARVRLESAYAGALEALALQATQERDGAAAVGWWRRLATVRPYDGRIARRLVEALEAAGDRAGAVRHVRVHAALLRADLEMEPDRALLERAEQLRSDQRGLRADRERTSGRSGEPGPAMMEPADATGAPVPMPAREAGTRGTTPARQRGRRHLIPVAVAVAAVLGGFAAHRWFRAPAAAVSGDGGAVARPVLAGERILVADFSESAADTLLGDAISQALRLGLARSSVLRVAGGPTVAEALRRMRRSADTPLDPDVAREVAVREGIKGVIQGEVRQAGGYLITAALEVAATGDRVRAWDVTARDSTDLPAAIERLVESIRRDAGESLAAIEPGERPWARTPTTSSLPALRKHLEGLRAFWRGEYLRSADLQEEAIALDPDFGNAHLTLAAALISAGPTSTRALKAWTRAYELRDQLSAAERYAAVANNALYVSGNLPAAIDAYRSHIEATRMSGAGGWYASYGEALMAAGHFSEAEQVLQEARQAFPTPLNQLALASALVRLGREPEAKAVIGEALARVPGHPALVLAGAHLAAVSGDYVVAHAIADTVYASPSGRVAALLAQGTFDATRGRLREAIVHFRALEQELRERGLPAEALRVAAAVAMLRLRLGERVAATAEMDSVLSRRPVGATDPVSYPYFRLAFYFAAAGQPVRAEAAIRRYLRAVPSDLRGPDLRELYRTRAAVRLAQGRSRDALTELGEAAKHPRLRVGLFDGASGAWQHYISVDALPELARVYDRLGMRDSAVAVYERYLGVRDLYRTYVDGLELGDALVRLTELHEAAGEPSRAAHHSHRLEQLWRDADPELRRVDHMGARRAVAGDQR